MREALGVELELREVGVGLLPPRIELDDATFRTEEYAVRVAHAVCEVAWLPLLTQARADLLAVRLDGPLALQVGTARMAAEAVGALRRNPGGGWHLALSGALETGGTFALGGDRQVNEARGVLSIDGVDSAALTAVVSSLVGRERGTTDRLSQGLFGLLYGQLALAPDRDGRPVLTVSLRSPLAKLDAADVRIEGPVEIEAMLDWSGALPEGSFEVDASRANVGHAGGLHVASGDGATLRGLLIERGGALRVEDVRLSVSAFRGRLEAEPPGGR